jgi:aminoglycoside phosphotransferase (APT) family kinase protein
MEKGRAVVMNFREDCRIEYEIRLAKKILGLPENSVIELNTSGWTSRIYIYNRGEFVIKFPLNSICRKECANEIRANSIFRELFPDTPDIISIGEGYEYLAYKGVIGFPFNEVETVSDKTKAGIGRILGSFLKDLHKRTPEGFECWGYKKDIEDSDRHYSKCREYLAVRLKKEESETLETFMTRTFPEAFERLGDDLVFSHGDLGYWNMILKEDGKIGIIDFGDAGYADRALDFAGMEDKVMLDSALEVYGDSEELREKIMLRRMVLPVMELPYYIEKKNMNEIESAFRRIKMNINRMKPA